MNPYNPRLKNSFSRLEWALFAVFVLALATQLTNEFNNPDGIGNYALLRSAALDRDLFHLNEFEALDMSPYFYSPSPTGYIRNMWPAGCALLWAPFFLAGRLAVLVSGMDPGGYTALDALAITFASGFYGFLALWLCLRMLSARYSMWLSFTAVAAVWLGTSLFCYQFYFAALAHSCSAFAATCFVYLWRKNRFGRSRAEWALLGGVAAVMAMTRTETVLLSALPVLDTALAAGKRKELARGLPVYAAAAFVCFTPQMVVWWTINGSPFRAYQGSVSLILANPHMREVLFSAYHGLFSWTPVIIPALAGWALRARRDAAGALGVFMVFFVLLYVGSCLVWWWGGGAFGARLFIGLFPLFAWGLAEFLDRLPRSAGVPLVALCAGWTGLLLLQFLSGMIFLEKFYTFAALAGNGKEILTHPAGYLKIFITPKLAGVPVLSSIIWMAVAAGGLFVAIKSLAGRFTAASGGGLLACLCLFAAGWLVFCRANGGDVAARNADGLRRAGEYTLEELYEPFPLQYADYYVRSGRIKDAVKELQRLEKLLPGNPAVPVAQAGIYLMTGDKELARAKAEKAARMEMRHPATRRTLRRIARALNK